MITPHWSKVPWFPRLQHLATYQEVLGRHEGIISDARGRHLRSPHWDLLLGNRGIPSCVEDYPFTLCASSIRNCAEVDSFCDCDWGGNGLGLASDWWISGRGAKGGHWKRGGPGGEGPRVSFGGEGGYSTPRAMVRGRGHVARARDVLQVLFLLRRRKRVISCAWHASHRVALARAKPLRKTTSDATPGRLCPMVPLVASAQ
eukprot:scaffold1000_cov292-Pavlova_lutheri.AAC.1